MGKLIPADTVDANGTVWETTGENIRSGAKEFSETDIKTIVNILFPVGSIYCGENSFITSVGTWELITTQALLFLGARNAVSGTAIGAKAIPVGELKDSQVYALRLWKRVS